MPIIYAAGSLEVTFELDSDEDSFIVDEWNSSENRSTCDEYDHPYINLNFIIENPIDEFTPWMLGFSEKDAYEGGITCTKTGNNFVFVANGKFKFSVNKGTQEKIIAGEIPRLEGVSYFRQGHSDYKSNKNDIKFSKKKL